MQIRFPASPAKVVFILALIYLGAQAFTGQQGILSWRQYAAEADELQKERLELSKKREALENQIKLMHGDRENRDFIEEQALQKLDMIAPDDKVINLPN